MQRESRTGVEMRERVQDLRPALDFLRTTARDAGEFLEEDVEREQHLEMISLHGRKLDQPGSNLKKIRARSRSGDEYDKGYVIGRKTSEQG